jgi:hypothetical protein
MTSRSIADRSSGFKLDLSRMKPDLQHGLLVLRGS